MHMLLSVWKHKVETEAKLCLNPATTLHVCSKGKMYMVVICHDSIWKLPISCSVLFCSIQSGHWGSCLATILSHKVWKISTQLSYCMKTARAHFWSYCPTAHLMQQHTTWHNINFHCYLCRDGCIKCSNVVECALLVYLLCQPVHLSIYPSLYLVDFF